jgi:hypothetical protein
MTLVTSSLKNWFAARAASYGLDLAQNDGTCALVVRQGPEGRPPNVSPARKGWESIPR